MSKKVSPIPRGYRTATPCLTVISVDSAVAFYQAAFNAEVLNSHLSADDSITVHATIKIGNSMIVLNQEAPEQGILSPLSTGVSGSQMHLYVDDVEIARSDIPPLLPAIRGLQIGAGKNLEPGTFWSGLIDDVRIYDRVVKP